PTFGSGGTVSVPNPAGTSVYRNTRALAIQPDGKIAVLALWNIYSQFDLLRFNTNGSLDATFGVGGEVLTSPPVVTNYNRVPQGAAPQGGGHLGGAGIGRALQRGGVNPDRHPPQPRRQPGYHLLRRRYRHRADRQHRLRRRDPARRRQGRGRRLEPRQ